LRRLKTGIFTHLWYSILPAYQFFDQLKGLVAGQHLSGQSFLFYPLEDAFKIRGGFQTEFVD
jgi:hypothetical protein